MLINNSDRIGVVVHDAGAALLVFCHLNYFKLPFHSYIKGPALKLIPEDTQHVPYQSFSQMMLNIDVLITGTSYPASVEMEAISAAKELGIRTISFVDSWVNYLERFKLSGTIIKPDIVVLTDDIGYSKARNVLKDFNLVREQNYYKVYMQKLYDAYLGQSSREPNQVLYFTEPTSTFAKKMYNDPKYWGYDEFDALNYFFENFEKIGSSEKNVVIKIHPSESITKYSDYFAAANVVASHKPEDFFVYLTKSKIVAGCTTMALHVSTWFNKRVISTIPPGGRGFYLPSENIEFLSQIKN